jgi:hypothetical protein
VSSGRSLWPSIRTHISVDDARMLAKELGRALEQVPVNVCKISHAVEHKLLLHVAILTLRE